MGNKRRQKGKDAVSPTPARREGRQGLTRILVFLSVAVSLSMMVALIFRNGGSMAMIRSSMLRAPVTNIRGALDEARDRGSGAVSASARALGRGAIGDATRGAPKLFTYEIIREFHHDPSAFTQGLLYYEGKSSYGSADDGQQKGVLYESTGLYRKTAVRALDADTGAVLGQNRAGSESITLDSENEMNPQGNFGEGLALVESHADGAPSAEATLLQLTWHSNVGYAFDARTLSATRKFHTELTDGWGLTGGITRGTAGITEGDENEIVLAATDSGTKVYYLDSGTMKTVHEVEIRDGVAPVPWLNELEFIGGALWGNVFMTECIAMIEPATGIVKGWIDMAGLRDKLLKEDQGGNRPDVLNGIAFDESNDRLFLTGKLWSKMFEVRIVEVSASDAGQMEDRARSMRRRCIPKSYPI